MTESEFTLKTMPPRLPREALERRHLERAWDQIHDRAAIVIAASAGFGKTTLLLQWRRRWMENGALVAWLDADDQTSPSVSPWRCCTRCAPPAGALSIPPRSARSCPAWRR
jgi:LuxR family maltose regulon positive regulatory protein